MASPRKVRDPHWNAALPAGDSVDVRHLHGALVNVLRLLREVDRDSGLSPSRLSVLSVLVFVGPMSQADLARVEGISAPSMSLLVRELETDGFVARAADPADARRTIVTATPVGHDLMLASQRRRLDWLAAGLQRVSPQARKALGESGAHLTELIAALRASQPDVGR